MAWGFDPEHLWAKLRLRIAIFRYLDCTPRIGCPVSDKCQYNVRLKFHMAHELAVRLTGLCARVFQRKNQRPLQRAEGLKKFRHGETGIAIIKEKINRVHND